MRFKALTVAALAAGSLAFGATPASAAQNWQAVNTNGNWWCTDYHQHEVSDYVNFKVCRVRNANNDAQAVLVVQNKASVAVSISGAVYSNFGSNVECAATTLNPGFTRGCFAPTVHIGAVSESSLAFGGRFRLNGNDDWLEVNY